LKIQKRLKRKTLSIRHRVVLETAKLLAPSLASVIEQKESVRPMIMFLQRRFGNKPLFGAEVGVHKGINAKSILETLNVSSLVLVDAYTIHKHSDTLLYLSCKVRSDYVEAKQRLLTFKDKLQWKICLSIDAAKTLPDDSLDFVYVDAMHDYDNVFADLGAYFPKVKRGGVLGGHDFSNVHPGVIEAVTDFVFKHKLKLFVEQPDWWIVKN
jgi:hypothetical protein